MFIMINNNLIKNINTNWMIFKKGYGGKLYI